MKLLCRVCRGRDLQQVWDFGPSPLANSFKTTVNKPEVFYPLTVNLCRSCGNVQSGYVVDPDLLFKNYLYASSTSAVFRAHFENFAKSFEYVNRVVDIGSNDGVLLRPFQKLGVKVLGVDPAKNIKSGLPTLREYFTRETAKKIGQADLVTCMNAFAHIDNLDEVVRGVKMIIQDTGIFVIEVQYLLDQLKNKYFDNVYHEHVQFWSVTALEKYCIRHGLTLYHVEHIDTHGGSIRAFIGKSVPVGASVRLAKAKEKGIPEKLVTFASEVRKNKERLLTLLFRLKNQGKTIIGYGAPAKSTTLCNYFGIGRDILDYIVDDSPLKQGLYTPGKNIPIVRAIRGTPDYILILAWNFAESIMTVHPGYKYIIPCPKPRII